MFTVMDGQQEILPYLHHFDCFRRCNEILTWLIQNRLTGKEFLSWVRGHFGQSMLEVSRMILMRIDREKETMPVLWGRDIVH